MIIYTEGLLSKWGFNDGSPWEMASGAIQDAVFDGLSYEGQIGLFTDVLKLHVLPKLSRRVGELIDPAVHNHWRASTIDGQSVEHLWTEHRSSGLLTPSSVEVPDEIIMAMIAERKHRGH